MKRNKKHVNDKKSLTFKNEIKEFKKGDKSFLCGCKNFSIEARNDFLKEGILFQEGKYKVEMVPISLKDEKVSIPLLEDNCVKLLKYNGLDDLEYGITSSGLKETIVIKEKREEYGFSFLVKMTNLIFDDGTKTFKDKETLKEIFKLGKFVMFDSSKRKSTDIITKVIKETEDSFNLIVLPDKGWINDEKSITPIYIDPTIESVKSSMVYLVSDNDEFNIDSRLDGALAVGYYYGELYPATIQFNFSEIINQIKALNLLSYKVYVDFTFDIENARTSELSGRYIIKDDETIVFDGVLAGKESVRVDVTQFVKYCILNDTTFYALEITNAYNNPSESSGEDSIYHDYILINSEYNQDETLCPRLTLEYNVSQEIKPSSEAIRVIENGKAGSTSINLYDGSFTHKFNVCGIKQNSLELNIKNVFNSKLFNSQSIDEKPKYFGKGWKSNLHQYLLKHEKIYSVDGTKPVVIFIDGEGYRHDFYEKWYYEVDEVKYYVDKENVYLDNDKKLKTKVNEEVFEVYYDVESDDGLTLVSSSSMYNYRQEYNPTLQDRYYIELYNEEKLYIFVVNGSAYIPLFKSEDDVFYSYHLIEKNDYGQHSYNNQLLYQDVIRQIEFNGEGEYILEDLSFVIKKEQTTNLKNKEEIEEYYINEDILSINNQIETLRSYVEQQKAVVEDYKKAIGNCILYDLDNMNDDTEEQEQDDSSNALDASESLLEKIQTTRNGNQRDEYIEKYYEAVDKLNEYKDLLRDYENRKEALVNIQLSSINDFIVDEDGNTLGFNGFGQLILIQDKFENTININYDEENKKITSVSSEKEIIKFNYQNDLLTEIIDGQGKIIKFNYDEDEMMIGFITHDNKNEQFNYEDEFKVTNDLSNVVSLTFNSDGLVASSSFSFRPNAKVTPTGLTNSTSTLKKLMNERYLYHADSTVIIDVLKSRQKRISFDTSKRVVSFEDEDITVRDYDEDKLLFEFTYKESLDKLYDIEQEITNEMDLEIGDAEYLDLLSPRTNFAGLKIDLGDYTLSSQLALVDIDMKVETCYDEESFVFEKRYSNISDRIVVLPFKLDYGVNVIKVNIKFNEGMNLSKVSGISIVKLFGQTYDYDDEDRLIKVDTSLDTISYSEFVEDKPTLMVHLDRYGKETANKYLYNSNGRLIYSENNYGDVEENIYDEKDNLIEIRVYNKENPSLAKVNKFSYDDSGNVICLDGLYRDESGQKRYTEIEYVPGTSLQRKVITESGQCICYGYDKYTNELISVSSTSDEKNISSQFKYQHGLMTEMKHNNQNYEYTYDTLGRVCNVKTDGTNNYVTHNYNDAPAGTSIVITTNAMNYTKESRYNKDNQLIRTVVNNSDVLQYSYDSYGRLSRISGSIGGAYTYDEETGNVSRINIGSKSISYQYQEGKLSIETITSDSGVKTYTYNYDEKDNVSKVISGSLNMSFEYDGLNRKTKQILKNNSSQLLSDEYSYLQVEDNTLDLIKEHNVKLNKRLIDSFTYKYDKSQNITHIITEDNETRYQYDSLNRLVREDNPLLNKTITYKYDEGGNVLLKKEYAYTLNEKLYEPNNRIIYTYANDSWKDQLTNYNDQTIQYDNLGKMTMIGSLALTWNLKSELTSYKGCQFEYDVLGQRITKTTNSSTTTYDVVEGIILGETTNGNVIKYIYSLNKLIGFEYNGVRYLYERNIQGDIIKIFRESDLTLIAEYRYDAYGNHQVYDAVGNINSNETFIGNINPFRYRGYYFDKETQLYWVSSRYYSPELCRWISPDSIEYLDPESINGLNLYCYCFNNPVNYVDPDGHMPFLLALLILGAIGMVANVGSQALTDLAYGNEFKWENYLVAAGAGFLGGMCYAIPGVGSIVSAAVTSGLTTAGQMAVSGEDYDGWDYLIMAGGSAVLSGLTAWGFGKLSNNMAFFKDSNFILDNFTKFATNYGGITLKPTVILQAAGQIAIRETVAGFVGAPLSGLLGYFDRVYRLNKLGLSPADSFRYAF